ncbi:MAG: carbon storage regulator CsrA [Phycisphaeraceae bacterium]|nr:carbon storage regulator CsrA [Phycisphaeraceae bacterium]
MLVLSRQRDETIMIGDDVEITVVDIRGDKVRLGITAPTRIAVHRKEVYDAIKSENERASRINNNDVNGVGPRARPGFAARGSLGAARLARATTPAITPVNQNPAGGPPATGFPNAQSA